MADQFENMIVDENMLEFVGPYRAIVPRGQTRPHLTTDVHKSLVREKYNDGKQTHDHITIFRVPDKHKLPPKEKNNHTVQGPQWTPPSSVGYVKGAISSRNRIWSATEFTENNLKGKNGEPSIFARESMTAILAGWMAREPQECETYTNTKRPPVTVLTPPISPKLCIEGIKYIMDVNAGWNRLPLNLHDMVKFSSQLPKVFTDCLKRERLHRLDVNEELITIVLHTKGVLKLVKNNELSLVRLNELMGKKEVVKFLSKNRSSVVFDKIMHIYLRYIDESECNIRYLSFKKFYHLLYGFQYHAENSERILDKLLDKLDLSIELIVQIFHKDPKMFCAFANDDAISFFLKYSEDIDITEMVDIYCNNNQLFNALINDHNKSDLLEEMGVDEFIREYEHYQTIVSRILEEDSWWEYYDDEPDPYDFMVKKTFFSYSKSSHSSNDDYTCCSNYSIFSDSVNEDYSSFSNNADSFDGETDEESY